MGRERGVIGKNILAVGVGEVTLYLQRKNRRKLWENPKWTSWSRPNSPRPTGQVMKNLSETVRPEVEPVICGLSCPHFQVETQDELGVEERGCSRKI